MRENAGAIFSLGVRLLSCPRSAASTTIVTSLYTHRARTHGVKPRAPQSFIYNNNPLGLLLWESTTTNKKKKTQKKMTSFPLHWHNGTTHPHAAPKNVWYSCMLWRSAKRYICIRYHIIWHRIRWYHLRWYHIISRDVISYFHHIISYDVIWSHMV